MVLCKFFLQGNCRFGSKCNNEHIDIKQIIKTDIESAINGRQWPFSCFGPFKDKKCIPNLTDQSFEEIRLMCYEAKQKNCLEQFDKQFKEQALEATNKMMGLLTNSMDVIVNLYDSPVDNGNNGPTMKSNNPFGLGAAQQSNNSLFNKPAASTGSIFGSSFNTMTTTNTNSLFGGNQLSQPQSGSIFGGSNNTSVFGGGQIANQQAPSSFFQQTPAAAKPANSIFGGGSTTQGSIFGGSTVGSNNIFAQAAQQTAIPLGGGNLFAQKPQTGFGLFGQANVQQQQQQQNSMFGQSMQANGTNMFGQPMTQMQQTQAHPMEGQSIFGQAAQQSQPQSQPQPGFFQQAMEQTQMQTNSQMTAPPPSMVSDQVYSKMEQLTAEEIEAFKAIRFLPGKVPLKPPPRELVN